MLYYGCCDSADGFAAMIKAPALPLPADAAAATGDGADLSPRALICCY